MFLIYDKLLYHVQFKENKAKANRLVNTMNIYMFSLSPKRKDINISQQEFLKIYFIK